MNQGWADLIALAQSGKQHPVSIADSLWLRDGVAFLQPFLDTNRDYFAAEMRELPPDPDTAAAAINDWVEGHTAGRIKDIVKPEAFNEMTILGARQHHPPEGEVGALRRGLDAGRAVHAGERREGRRADDARRRAGGPVAQTDRYDAVALSTKELSPSGSSYPGEGVGAEELLGEAGCVAAGGLCIATRTSRRAASPCRASPAGRGQDLEADLAAMGMPRAFSASEAEFAGIADVGPERIFISKVVQKTFGRVQRGRCRGRGRVRRQHGDDRHAAGRLRRPRRPPVPVPAHRRRRRGRRCCFMGLIRDPR